MAGAVQGAAPVKSVGVLADMTTAKVKPQLDEDSMRFVVASPNVCVATADPMAEPMPARAATSRVS